MTLDLRRVSVVGPSGSGKSTVARILAGYTQAPLIELDALWHDAHWVNPTPDEFARRVAEATRGERWIVDGKYLRVREAIWSRATCVVWLDLPRHLASFRATKRTLIRTVRRTELWNGNRERFSDLLARDGVIRYGWRTYADSRARMVTMLSEPRFAHLTRIHLRSPREIAAWLSELRARVPDAP